MIPIFICYDPISVRQHFLNRPMQASVCLFNEDSQFLDIALPVFKGKGATTADMLLKTQPGGCYAPQHAVLLGSVHALHLDGHPDIVIGTGWWHRYVGCTKAIFSCGWFCRCHRR